MKLAYFDDFRLGAVKGDAIIDLTPLLTALPHRDTQDLMPALIADFAAHRARLEAHVATAAGVPLRGVRLRAPMPRARQIDCMATNYMESGTLPKPPAINAFHNPRALSSARATRWCCPTSPPPSSRPRRRSRW